MANCQNYQNEIETAKDFSNQNSLSTETSRHLENCATCQTHNAERESLHKLMQKLERVSAPTDFDFRLRAKLNQRKTVPTQTFSFLTWRKIAVFAPASFAIILLAIFGLRNFQQQNEPVNIEQAKTETSQKPQIVAQPAIIQNDTNANEQNSIAAFTNSEAAQKTASIDAVKKSKNIEPIKVKRKVERVLSNESTLAGIERSAKRNAANGEEKSMSRDLAVERAAPSIMPRGFSNPLETSNSKTDLRDLLTTFGIETKEGFRVSDVKENSLAMRSGLMKNDVIQTVNGETVNEKITLPNQLKVIILNVLRDGKTHQIKLAGDDKK
ncbi:MAG: hypothetical protein H7Z37_00590 [Pyrinomonadaceae bacterium]|nr:hypothetical protein [Pyrinomonadaceae bacterium]